MLVVVLLVVVFCVYLFRRRRVYKLAKNIPAPPDINHVFGVLRYMFQGTAIIPPLMRKYSRFAIENNGVIKLITEPFLYVAITGREDSEYVLKNCLVKDRVMDLFHEVIGNAGIYAPVSIWVQRRKMLVPAFGPKILKGFISTQARQAQRLAEQLALDGRVGTGPFKLWPYINAYTLGSIAETALGIKMDAQGDSNIPFLKALSDILTLLTRKVIEIWLWPVWIYKFSSLHREIKNTKPILYKLPDKIIQEKREATQLRSLTKDPTFKRDKIFGQDPEEGSFLDHLIALSTDENKLNNEELREEILVMLLAGTDSSAVAIGYTLQLLAMYPEVQEKLYNEICNVLGKSDRNLNENDLKELHYLHKVVKESIRLFTPVPIIVRKTGAEEIKLPSSGITLPPGTGIVVSLWGLNRDPKYWGPDADYFNPDRVWDDSVQNAAFSLGPRNCIGYKYALQSVQIAVASVVRRYRVVGRRQRGPPHVPSTYSVMMRSSDDFTLALETR